MKNSVLNAQPKTFTACHWIRFYIVRQYGGSDRDLYFLLLRNFTNRLDDGTFKKSEFDKLTISYFVRNYFANKIS